MRRRLRASAVVITGASSGIGRAVTTMMRDVIERAHRAGREVGLCGPAPSDHPDFARLLVEAGIDSISVTPDSLVGVKQHVATAEGAGRGYRARAARPAAAAHGAGLGVEDQGAHRWCDLSMGMRVIVVLVVLTAAGCAGPVVSLSPWPDGDPHRSPLTEIWVVRHGWHTRVAVRRADVDPSIWPESRDLGDVGYLEVGWGDRDFYPKSDPSIWDTIDPVIRATPAALHVGGLDRPPSEVFPDDRVVRLSVPAHGIDRLAAFVHAHYVRDAAGTPRRIGSGYYPRSWFYLAEGWYHALTYNSNHWTATALQAAGASTDPSVAATAGAVIRQARGIAASKAATRAVGR